MQYWPLKCIIKSLVSAKLTWEKASIFVFFFLIIYIDSSIAILLMCITLVLIRRNSSECLVCIQFIGSIHGVTKNSNIKPHLNLICLSCHVVKACFITLNQDLVHLIWPPHCGVAMWQILKLSSSNWCFDCWYASLTCRLTHKHIHTNQLALCLRHMCADAQALTL